jgi:hypothetical protein
MDESNDNSKQMQRSGGRTGKPLSYDDVLSMFLSACSYAAKNGVSVASANDDSAGALVITIKGARRDVVDGATRFSQREIAQPATA